ncbi:MAG: tetratricopeptide repeat protein [Bacteroidales bacterium]|nr:tetratricopeptide repeat protein [Bacteroidales bacterium]
MKRFFVALAGLLMLAGCGESSDKNDKQSKENQQIVTSAQNEVTDTLDVNGYINRARWYLANEKIGNAIRDINSALSIDGKNVDALLVLADIYYALGDQDNIMMTLNKATEISPLDSRPIIKLAELSFLQGNTNLANAYLDKALELKSLNPQAYYMRGVICLYKNDTVQALKQFMKARNQDDSFIDPVLQIASIYSAQRNPMAYDFYALALQMEPDNLGLYYDLAMYMQDNGKPEKALEIYDTLDVRMPGNYNVLFNKGYVNLVYLSNYDKAIEWFDKALEINPKSVDALLNKGVAYEQKGNFKQATSIYLRILRDNPNYQLAIDALNRMGD